MSSGERQSINYGARWLGELTYAAEKTHDFKLETQGKSKREIVAAKGLRYLLFKIEQSESILDELIGQDVLLRPLEVSQQNDQIEGRMRKYNLDKQQIIVKGAGALATVQFCAFEFDELDGYYRTMPLVELETETPYKY